MRKFLFLLVLSAIARKVVAAIKTNQSDVDANRQSESLNPTTH